MIYLTLFFEFFKIGLFAIGGGMATIPFLYDLLERYPWFTQAQLTDMIAISQATPGPIGINMATFVGYQAAFEQYGVFGGILGGITTTLAIITPCFVIILIISRVLSRFDQNPLVRRAFAGLRPAVAALIGVAAFEIIRITLIDIPAFSASGSLLALFEPLPILIFGVCLTLMIKLKKVDPTWYLLGGAILGIVLKL